MKSRIWMVVGMCVALCGSAAVAEILGPEMVVNGTFDTDTSGWNVYQGGWLGTDGDPAGGCVALNQGDANAYALQWVSGIEAGKTYKFSYHFMSPDAGAGVIWAYPWVRTEETQGGTTVVSDYTFNDVTTSAGLYFVPGPPFNDHLEARTNWQSHDIYVVPGAGATVFRIQFAVSDPHEFRFDSFSLREVVPEPATMTLMAVGAGAGLLRRRRAV